MIIHIMGNDKFAFEYINLINQNFSMNEHLFFLLEFENMKKKYPIVKANNVYYIRKNFFDLFKLMFYIFKSNKIIFHGLFSRLVMLLIFLTASSFKTYCVLWGGDLYSYKKENFIQYLIKKYIISHSKGIIMELEEDYLLARKWYKAKCPYFNCMLYLSNIIKVAENSSNIKSKNNSLMIQIGNSADPSNSHKEILDRLEKYKKYNINIFLPLSYGNMEYAQEISEYANEKFPQKVHILKDFIALNDYLEKLKTVDVAIFAHKRQQGLGNILSLIALGKRVYIRSDVTVYKALSRMGIKIFPTENFEKTLFDKLTEFEVNQNIEIAKKIGNETKLISDWDIVFQD